MIHKLMEELQFPAEAIGEIEAAYQAMCAYPNGRVRMEQAAHDLFDGDAAQYMDQIKDLAEDSGVHPYAADMAFGLYCALILRKRYAEKGLADELFLDAMADLRYKLMECKAVKGEWGSFVAKWWKGFFRMERFALGRLQYEHMPFRCEEYHGIKKDDVVYNCHIPSSGPLRREEVLASLKKAHSFYHDELKDSILPVVCSSWLLYPPMYEVYPENSNLRRSYELFEILETKETDLDHNLWRIFNVENTPLKELPENTSLQQRLKQYLLAGGEMGSGYGVLLFDGKKILKMS